MFDRWTLSPTNNLVSLLQYSWGWSKTEYPIESGCSLVQVEIPGRDTWPVGRVAKHWPDPCARRPGKLRMGWNLVSITWKCPDLSQTVMHGPQAWLAFPGFHTSLGIHPCLDVWIGCMPTFVTAPAPFYLWTENKKTISGKGRCGGDGRWSGCGA